jgi:hypothetical protein
MAAPWKTPPADCYLCGEPLARPFTLDHVPPRQLYAAEVRKAHSPHLLTIRVHDACNQAYQHDEDYFVAALMPFASGSYSGNAIYKEVLGRFRKGKTVPLVRKVLAEFDRRPSGLILPPTMVAKRFEGKRIKRVVWKIIRGLYFHNTGRLLPEKLKVGVQIIPPDQVPPEEFLVLLWDRPNLGKYPGVFDYRFLIAPELDNFHYWAFLLWDRIIVTACFQEGASPSQAA